MSAFERIVARASKKAIEISRDTKKAVRTTYGHLQNIVRVLIACPLILSVLALIPWQPLRKALPLFVLIPLCAFAFAAVQGSRLFILGGLTAIATTRDSRDIGRAGTAESEIANQIATVLSDFRAGTRKLLGIAAAVTALEIAYAIFLRVVPVSNDPWLFLLMISAIVASTLFFAAHSLFGMSETWGLLGVVFGIAAIVFACALCLGGSKEAWAWAAAPKGQGLGLGTETKAPEDPDLKALRSQIVALNEALSATGVARSSSSNRNNPLNIKYSPQVGAIGGSDSGVQAKDGGTFASFVTIEEGIRAGRIMLTEPSFGYSTLTVEAALRRWSNGAYGAEIVPGIPGATVASQLTPSQLDWLIAAIALRESGSANNSMTAASNPDSPGSNLLQKVPGVSTPEFNVFKQGDLTVRVLACTLNGQLRCTGEVVWGGEHDVAVRFNGMDLYADGRSIRASEGRLGARRCFYGDYKGVPCWPNVVSGVPLAFEVAFDPDSRPITNPVAVEANYGVIPGGPNGTLQINLGPLASTGQ
jgi:hypothetical protein